MNEGAYKPWDGIVRNDDGGAGWYRLCDVFVEEDRVDERVDILLTQYGTYGRVFASWDWNCDEDGSNMIYTPCWLRAVVYEVDGKWNACVYIPSGDYTVLLTDPHEATILAAVRDLLLAETQDEALDDWAASRRVNYVNACVTSPGDRLTRA